MLKPKIAAILPVKDPARGSTGEPVRYGLHRVGPLCQLPSGNQSQGTAKIVAPEREK
jgi:hypothetical protein